MYSPGDMYLLSKSVDPEWCDCKTYARDQYSSGNVYGHHPNCLLVPLLTEIQEIAQLSTEQCQCDRIQKLAELLPLDD